MTTETEPNPQSMSRNRDGDDIRARGRQIMYGIRLENVIDRIVDVTLSEDVYNNVNAYNRYYQGVRRLDNLLSAYMDENYLESYRLLQGDAVGDIYDRVHFLDSKMDLLMGLMKRGAFSPLDDSRHNSWVVINNWKNRLGDEDDVQVIITGKRNTGKSTVAIELARRHAESYGVEFDITKQIFRNSIDMRNYIYECKPPIGTPIIWDEAGGGKGLGKRRAMTRENIEYNEMIQIIRGLQLVMIYTAPKEKQMDSDTIGMFSCWLDTVRLDKHEKLCTLKYKVKQKNGDYFVFLKDTNKNRITEITVPKAPSGMITWYKRFKQVLMYDKVKVTDNEKKKKYRISIDEVVDGVLKDSSDFMKDYRGKKLVDHIAVYNHFKDKNFTVNESKEVKRLLEKRLSNG